MTTQIYSPLTLADVHQSIQSTIRLPFPIVLGNCDYQERQFGRMNEILMASGIESWFIDRAVQHPEATQ